jgi:methyltransferase (TIGR00027 family)
MSIRLPAGIGRTALGVAMIRALESQRPDRLFDDPYAKVFLAAAPGVFDEQVRATTDDAGTTSLGAVLAANTALRTRFYDDQLLAAAGAGVRQVVLLAAGLDTRAYRLAWPADLRLYELDLPEMLDFKAATLAGSAAVARCGRVAVPADLREGWAGALLAAGFDRAAPTAWLIEGLLIYLSAEEADRLLTAVTDLSAPGSRLALEYEDLDTDPVRAAARTAPAWAEYTALWKGGLPDYPSWLRGRGWTPIRHDRGAIAAGYGRPSARPATGGFVTATRD